MSRKSWRGIRRFTGHLSEDFPFLLVELERTTIGQKEQGLSDEEKARALDDIWPVVNREVNEIVADIVKIKKDMIIIVDCPLKLTGKGTVDRRGAFLEFKGEIDRLYARAALQHKLAQQQAVSDSMGTYRAACLWFTVPAKPPRHSCLLRKVCLH